MTKVFASTMMDHMTLIHVNNVRELQALFLPDQKCIDQMFAVR